MNDLTWTCHICGEERPDRLIGVVSFPYKGLSGAMMNIRYCFDKKECHDCAVKVGKTGEFPHRKQSKAKTKWWQIWK